jgi:alkylation response protein AidB-like acyl-CoA dehydrogenase
MSDADKLRSGLLTEQHLEIQEMARDFAESRVMPIAHELDEPEGGMPEDLIQDMAKLGFFALLVPEEHGGLGLDAISFCLVTEELCRANLAVGSVISRAAGSSRLLDMHGTQEQKDRWLAKIATGEIQTASAGTEPDAGSDAANIKTTAKFDGEKYVVNGSKLWTTFADRADMLRVYVRTSNEHKHKGVSLLMVEKEPGTDFAPPHLTGSHIPVAGYRGMRSYALYFDDLEVPRENLIGGVEGEGFKQLAGSLVSARVFFAFRCIGLARAAYEAALTYAQQRVQFDKPIAEFQAVRFKLADMATQIQAARELSLSVARRYQNGGRVDLEAGMAKLFAAEMAHKVCWDALYIHGGNGYALESPVNRFWRDSGLLPIGEGTNDIQREVIARALLKQAKAATA